MVSRKASLEWNLETLGKLVIAAIILAFLFYMAFLLFGIFNPKEDMVARKNFEIMADRIQDVKDNSLTGPAASALIYLPDGFYFIGFDAGDAGKVIKLQKVDGTIIDNNQYARPPECSVKSACICLVKAGSAQPKYVDCKNIPYATVSSELDKANLVLGTKSSWVFFTDKAIGKLTLAPKSNGAYPFLISSQQCDVCVAMGVSDMSFVASGDNLMIVWSKVVAQSCMSFDATANAYYTGTCLAECFAGTSAKPAGNDCGVSSCCVPNDQKPTALKTCNVGYTYQPPGWAEKTAFSMSGYCGKSCDNKNFPKNYVYVDQGAGDSCGSELCCVHWSCKATLNGNPKDGFCSKKNCADPAESGYKWSSAGQGDCDQGYVCCFKDSAA